jgi:histidyl-tRNA synthetase
VNHISHRQLLEGLALGSGVTPDVASGVFRAVDKLAKIGTNGVRSELVDSGIDGDVASRLLDAITVSGTPESQLAELKSRLSGVELAEQAVNELTELFELLPALGVTEGTYCLNVSLARGLDYYTGPVFEALVEEPKIGSLLGGGRYDGLIGSFIGRSIPATGMSIGLDRIIEVVKEFNLLPAPPTVATVMVAVFPGLLKPAAEIAAKLRSGGLDVDLSLLQKKSLGEQLKYAGRRGIPFAVFAGQSELERGVAAIKDLDSGRQWTAPIDSLAVEVRAALADKFN